MVVNHHKAWTISNLNNILNDEILDTNQYYYIIVIANYFGINLTTNTKRPIGVTIIAILIIIGGIVLLIGGLTLIGLGAFLSMGTTETVQTGANSTDVAEIAALGMLPIIMGIIMLILGIAYLVVSYGLLKGKGWAWAITVIVTIIGLIMQIISAIVIGSITSSVVTGLASHIIGIIISGIIIFYMFRPHVKAFFRQ
jgi:hypothetical protein